MWLCKYNGLLKVLNFIFVDKIIYEIVLMIGVFVK